ncbi:MAG TPA: ABC transporter permease [Candidatus Limiplasma sp.]|nr:ABC transporter permease [Candidatus Limiplasma sp.]
MNGFRLLKKAFYEKRWVSRLFFFTLLLIVWEAVAAFSGISPLLLPPVEQVAAAFWKGMVSGTLFLQTVFSLAVIALGFCLSMILALVLAVASRLSPFMERMADTLTAMAHPLPGMALLPLIVIWFGTGTPAVTIVIVHACLWSMLLSLLSGMQSTPALYTDLGRSYSMGRLRIILEILLPASMAHLLAGLRVGWARAWRALISAEMIFGAIGATGGLGWYIFKERTMMHTAGLFAGIVLVAVIGMLVEELVFEKLEKSTLRKWSVGAQKEKAS